jgi:predicted acetyltransferase
MLCGMSNTALVVPSLDHLPQYVAALNRGWSPDHIRGAIAAQEELARIEADAALFLARCTNLKAEGGPLTLADGSKGQRLPGRNFWIWDADGDAFCGSINIRWQPGTAELPPHVLGHTGYAVVPWQQSKGHATGALQAVLPYLREAGLPFCEVTCDESNVASIKVIERAGGVLHERFNKPAMYGGAPSLRWRIAL